ncbi:MAG TPA: hypothetical protein VFF73_36270 [Planctomycetota bacterium]|nr:hypothetical protein [Planctomycetota bacterium]
METSISSTTGAMEVTAATIWSTRERVDLSDPAIGCLDVFAEEMPSSISLATPFTDLMSSSISLAIPSSTR